MDSQMPDNRSLSDKSRRNRIAGLLVACILMEGMRLHAAVWQNGVDGNWHDVSKWNVLPANLADVTIQKAGSYTVTVNDDTANLYPDSITNLQDVTRLGTASTDDHVTLLINFTNPAVKFSARYYHIDYDGPSHATLRITNGTVQARGPFYVYSSNAIIEVLGGKLEGDVQLTGSGLGLLVDGGDARTPVLTISSAIGPRVELRSGTLAATSSMRVGGAGTNRTGTFVMSGGTFSSPDIGIGWGVGSVSFTNVGIAIITGGVVNATNLFYLCHEAWSYGDLTIGGDAVVNAANLIQGRVGESMGSKLYINGGTVNITNGTLGHNSILTGYRHLDIISNGVVNVKDLGFGLGDAYFHGGLVSVANKISFSGPSVAQGGGTGTFEVASSGVLQWIPGAASTMTIGNSTVDAANLIQRDGGTIRFVGANANNPNLTVSAGSTFAATNATIEFKDTPAASLTGNIATKIQYYGTNNLRLNAATNTPVTGYRFGSSPGTNFMHLSLLNGGCFQGNGTTFDTGSSLMVTLSGTGASSFGRLVDTGTLTLDGTLYIVLADGYKPEPNDEFDILDNGVRQLVIREY
jgi:hypothetical protein